MRHSDDPRLDELEKDVRPEAVLEAIEQAEREEPK
jgi:hypothetical protein